METLQVILIFAIPAVIAIFLFRRMGRTLKTASQPVDDLVNRVEQTLRTSGLITEMKFNSSAMDGTLLARKRQGDMAIGFYLGRRAKNRDRPDKKLLARTDHRLMLCWWHHVGITLHPEAVAGFFPLAIRRRHQNTDAVWKYVKPWKWGLEKRDSEDPAFDSLFEILVDPTLSVSEFPDEVTRNRILSLKDDPYFDNLVILVSPCDVGYLVVINPPLPSDQHDIIGVAMDLANRWRGLPWRGSRAKAEDRAVREVGRLAPWPVRTARAGTAQPRARTWRER
jgi:hypothetical protein